MIHDRLHRNLVEAVVLALTEIFIDNRYADKVIERTLAADPRRGARDRAFIADTVYNIVRWWRLTGFYAGVEDKTDTEAIWRRVAVLFQDTNYKWPDWLEEFKTSERLLAKRKEEATQIGPVYHSIPNWLDELGIKALGNNKWQVEMESLNERAELVVRVNTLKTTRNQLKNLLEQHGLACDTSNKYPNAILVERKGSLFALPEFKEGLMEVQDAGSQTIAPFLQVEPGMRVIDACAGAGGKSLHMAALMENKGKLIAMDVEQHKLEELKRRARRAGASNIETRLIDDTKVIKRQANTADRLLMDAPCSGLGVLRRNPDAKWKLSPEFIEKVKHTQAEILDGYPSMLKPGGKMVYATCSILPDENEKQIKAFLKANSNYKLEDEKHIWPSEGFDGFYMALISKK